MRKTFAVVVIAFGLIAAACGESSESGAEGLIGSWDRAGTIWDIGADAIVVTNGGVPGFSYTATDSTISLIDEPSPNSCNESQTGTYEWEIVEAQLTLTLLNDPCAGRSNALGGAMFDLVE